MTDGRRSISFSRFDSFASAPAPVERPISPKPIKPQQPPFGAADRILSKEEHGDILARFPHVFQKMTTRGAAAAQDPLMGAPAHLRGCLRLPFAVDQCASFVQSGGALSAEESMARIRDLHLLVLAAQEQHSFLMEEFSAIVKDAPVPSVRDEEFGSSVPTTGPAGLPMLFCLLPWPVKWPLHVRQCLSLLQCARELLASVSIDSLVAFTSSAPSLGSSSATGAGVLAAETLINCSSKLLESLLDFFVLEARSAHVASDQQATVRAAIAELSRARADAVRALDPSSTPYRHEDSQSSSASTPAADAPPLPFRDLWTPVILSFRIPHPSAHDVTRLIGSAHQPLPISAGVNGGTSGIAADGTSILPPLVLAAAHELLLFKSQMARVLLRNGERPASRRLASFSSASSWNLSRKLVLLIPEALDSVGSSSPFASECRRAARLLLFRLFDEVCHAPVGKIAVALPRANQLFEEMWHRFRAQNGDQGDPLSSVASTISFYQAHAHDANARFHADTSLQTSSLTPYQRALVGPASAAAGDSDRDPDSAAADATFLEIPRWMPTLGHGAFPIWSAAVRDAPLSWRAEALLSLLARLYHHRNDGWARQEAPVLDTGSAVTAVQVCGSLFS